MCSLLVRRRSRCFPAPLGSKQLVGGPHLLASGGPCGPPAGRRLVAVCPLEQGISPDPHTITLGSRWSAVEVQDGIVWPYQADGRPAGWTCSSTREPGSR